MSSVNTGAQREGTARNQIGVLGQGDEVGVGDVIDDGDDHAEHHGKRQLEIGLGQGLGLKHIAFHKKLLGA